MMDKQRTAETILEVLKAGALVEPDKEEVWRAALVAGLEQAERLETLNGPAEKLYEALQTIKEHCMAHGTSCYGCLLSTDAIHGGCDFFDESPEDWDLEFLKGR